MDRREALEYLTNITCKSTDVNIIKCAVNALCILTPNEYQELAMRTCSEADSTAPDGLIDGLILQGVMGISCEAGEALDIVKKHLFRSHLLDKDYLIRKLGDVLFYVATCANELGVSLEDVMTINVIKLQDMYPDKFQI